MIYPITMYGDPVLRQRAQEIEQGTNLKQLVDDMFETMHAARGVGLAAPQIGKSIRLFIADGTPKVENFKKVFINPQILEEDGELWDFEEGCLSIPNIMEKIARKEKLRIRYFDADWNEFEEVYDGIQARIIQHEYDHIEGRLFTDYFSPEKMLLLQDKLADISNGNVETNYRVIAAK